MNEKSSVILGTCMLDGRSHPASLFDAGPGYRNRCEVLTYAPNSRLVAAGQAGLLNGQHALTVLLY